MREIKFRGRSAEDWPVLNIREGQWVFGNFVDGDVPCILGEAIEACSEYFIPEFWVPVDPETVGQYSGVRDVNNVAIYEGDIVTRGDGNFKVIYKSDKYYTGFVAIKSDANSAYIHLWYDGIKIIGNKYNNPELLRGVQ